ncbi:hypothetical protein FKW77_006844 [Venturia effusa]|uniref:Uncharacterized protein n=1 Tax=Venturia effusa TaxID=50376 RepID=A0A517L1J4_9PEZI|nr:hypothetical protein FKW77_006844 [Venturia effusa]
MSRNYYFHRPFNDRQPSQTIPLQPLPSLTTHFIQGNSKDYTSNRQYGHNNTFYHTQVSPMGSAKTPSTPGLQVTYQGSPTSLMSRNNGRTKTLPALWGVWLERMVIRWFAEWWLLEIISWSFSALCMVAIMGILVAYDGHTIPHWPLGLTINGFISVFSNIAKSALLLSTAESLGQLKWNWFKEEPRSLMDFERIDMASRGPWGAFLLLIRHKGTTLTSLGALIVILALPLDLFFQQIVTYSQESVPAVGMIGTIPRALTYDPSDGTFFLNGTEQRTSSRDITAFSEPVFLGNGSIPELRLSCPTANCTWESFDTLAVCSRCMDLSYMLNWSCKTAPADWLSTVASSDDSYPNVTACGYWFHQEEETVLMSGHVVFPNDTAGEALEMRIFSFTDPYVLSRQPILGGSLHFQDIQNPILDFLVAGTPEGSAGVYANKTPTLTECNLHWCVKTVESSFAWGRHDENTTKTTQLETSKEWPWYAFNDSEGKPHNRYLANFSLTLPPRNQPDLRNNSFLVTNLTAAKTILLMDEIAPSYVVAVDKSSSSQLRWLNGGQFFFDMPQELPMPALVNPWLPPNNITAHVEKLANLMTAVIRNTPDSNNKLQLVSGTAWNTRTFVHTRWEWISLPLGLLVLSLVFLNLTVAKTSRDEQQVGIWKTSVIAVLANGLGDDVQKSFGPNCRMGEARAKSRQIKVKLQQD